MPVRGRRAVRALLGSSEASCESWVTPNGLRALHVAAANNRAEVCVALAAHGAEVDAQDAEGVRPPVDQIAHQNDGVGWAMIKESEQIAELVEAAMNVANDQDPLALFSAAPWPRDRDPRAEPFGDREPALSDSRG